MTYTALAIDLDGTLLVGEDLSLRNRDAVAAAHQAGLAVIIATARWRHMAQRIADQIGLKQPIIACSGAQVYLPETGQDIFDHRLPADFVEELYALCNTERCIATVTIKDEVILKLDGEPDPSLLSSEMRWAPALSTIDHAAPRIAAIQGSAITAIIKGDMKARYAEQVNIYDSIGPTGKIVITVTAKAANKGEALLVSCQHLGINPAEVITFGDAENDIEMFKVSGASVAMGQASDAVKKAATSVTAANTEDGVAQAIERLLRHGTP
jgi:Cof subfamily protein (haloacid dehalogenase superfamily)